MIGGVQIKITPIDYSFSHQDNSIVISISNAMWDASQPVMVEEIITHINKLMGNGTN